MRERQYRLTDLVDLTGASPAQIGHWKKHKLLPGAVLAGRYSYYTQQTLDAIRFVMGCYEGNMSLSDIRDRLHGDPDDDGDDPRRP